MNADNKISIYISSVIPFLFHKEFFPDRIVARLLEDEWFANRGYIDIKSAISKWANNEIPLSPFVIRVEILKGIWYFEC